MKKTHRNEGTFPNRQFSKNVKENYIIMCIFGYRCYSISAANTVLPLFSVHANIIQQDTYGGRAVICMNLAAGQNIIFILFVRKGLLHVL